MRWTMARMRRFWLPLFAAALIAPVWALAQVRVVDENQAPGRTMAQQATKERTVWITADHSRHEPLQQTFQSGPEVTKACLSCHELAAGQFHKTIHWTWLDPSRPPEERIGKAGITLNNFCINAQSNWPRCTSCHAGYGWKDESFNFKDEYAVDCLVCHEQTGTYKKFPTGAGHPVDKPTVFKANGKLYEPPDWNKVAQSVARPTRKNCGTCHFFGGGGDAVKHGDLDSSMMMPNKALDVHMGTDGQDFDCVRCHTTELHRIAGRIYSNPAAGHRKSLVEDDLAAKIMCESCHTSTPHKPGVKANDHTDKVACQSCHIPTFARELATKMWWDWSTAGQKKEGKPFAEKGPHGKPSYDSLKGSFVWEKDVVPEYFWFNGAIQTLTAQDVVDPSRTVAVNTPLGSPDDPMSRIFPFKVHRGKQPYDKINKTVVIPKLFGPPGSGAYWADWDWRRSIEIGMQTAGIPFSGEFDFVETSYVFPITHMVAPKDQSLQCIECHSKEGRLQNLAGFYMPGRDRNPVVHFLGWAVVLGSLLGVFVHGIGRMVAGGRKEK
ncbi:Cytochrome c family protein [uncultured Desulfatiglans sp.]|uniref:Cytochrome c family protein n=1 Tax=Uncultured Desulfatiglans sp. TaxID=1748965 RepID=A0A653AF85_UNCDX|nr:Cytochrome c family protein [uncultured Desulfatiglans sp.]